MNIISNNCCGGFCYKYTNTEYNNPFIFASTRYDQLMYLLTGKVNFGKFTIEETIDPCRKGKCYDIVIDDKIRICYVHHIRDDSYLTPTIKGINVYYKYIYKYIVEKYVTRCKRLCETTEPMHFLLAPHPGCGSSDDLCKLAQLCETTKTPYCVLLPEHMEQQSVFNHIPSDRIIMSRANDNTNWVKQSMDLHYKECIGILYENH